MNKKCLTIVVALIAVFGCPSIQTTRAADSVSEIEILFEGNQVFTADQLRSVMSSGRGSQATSASNTEELQQGLQGVREFLMSEGYLTPRIGKPQEAQSPTGSVFRVPVDEGPIYRLGEVKVTGATVFSETQILKALAIKQGDTFKGDAVRIWFEKLKDMYANAGYLDWTPIPRQEITEPESATSDGTVNLTIDMDEGSRL